MKAPTHPETHCERDPSSLRVLHVAQPTYAGVAVVVRDLVQHQIKQGLSVSVACPESNGDLSRQVISCGAEWLRWEATRNPGLSVIAETKSLRRIVEQVEPDLVHLHSSKAGLVGRLALQGRLPTVFEPNAWSFHAVSGPMHYAALSWEKLAARWTHATICVSDDELRTSESAGIRSPMHVIRNGVNLDHWPRPLLEEKHAARNELGLPEETPVVVSVGRLCRQKGQDLLLKAWPGLTAQHPNARLVLVGDGDARESLEELAQPSVHFAGASQAVRTWYLSADVVVMPSRWEGLSIALLEAMATARAVVAFNVSGMSDALTRDCGVLVSPESIADLTSALAALITDCDRRSALGAAARLRVETMFDIRTTCNRIADLYGKLIAR